MRPSGDRTRFGERGAALVEAAFVTPVFFALIFGIFEFGLLFRNNLTTNNAAQQGARAASVSGQRPDADYLVLRSIEHGLSAMDLDQLEYVVVFRADGPDDTVPTACLTASVTYTGGSSDGCNRYVAADFAKEIDDSSGNDTGNFRCSSTAVDRFWCPAWRETSISAGVEYVGIHIQTRHQFITGIFGDGKDLSETVILRLEPEST